MDTPVARFRYYKAGAGPPVLLLPGGGGWRLTFHAMVGVLAEQHTVFLDAVGLREVAIVGHSWGRRVRPALRGAPSGRGQPSCPSRSCRARVKDAWEFRLLRLPLVGEIGVLRPITC